MSDTIQTENFPNSTISQAVVGCHDRPWCTCICQQLEGNHILTDLYVIRDYVEAKSGNKLQCYTAQWRRLLFPSQGSSITGIETHQPPRFITNLEDGIFNGVLNTCYLSRGFLQYVLVDLKRIVLISSVRFRNQPIGTLENRNTNLRIRVGNETASGDFSTYQLLGTYKGPAVEYNIDIDISSDSGIFGRYISVQEDPVSLSYMQICTLEIN